MRATATPTRPVIESEVSVGQSDDDDLPPHLIAVLPLYPENTPRPTAAEIITKHVLQVSPRSLERWRDVPGRVVNGKFHGKTRQFLAAAWRRYSAAPERC